jgi:hypothetical protein
MKKVTEKIISPNNKLLRYCLDEACVEEVK